MASVTAQLTKEEPNQLAHVTNIDRVIYIQLKASCLLRGIIWQSDKQTDRRINRVLATDRDLTVSLTATLFLSQAQQPRGNIWADSHQVFQILNNMQ